MSALRPELQAVVELLLRDSAATGRISLDSIGDAIGLRAVSYVEVDMLIEALEQTGRVVESGNRPRGEHHLRAVIAGIRELTATLGRRPTPAEIAEHAGISPAEVSHALRLACMMQR